MRCGPGNGTCTQRPWDPKMDWSVTSRGRGCSADCRYQWLLLIAGNPKTKRADRLSRAMDVTKSSCSQVMPAARQVEKIPVMRIALLPAPVSPLMVFLEKYLGPVDDLCCGLNPPGVH